MNTKLTLSLDKKAIAKAKKYAYKNGDSVSKLVEKFFNGLEPEPKVSDKNEEYSPKLKKLIGVLKDVKIDNWKEEKYEYLKNKYLKD